MADEIIFKAAKREYLLAGEKWVLGPINICVPLHSSVCILGPSGSGKSTLLHLLGALDSISSGEIQVAGEDISQFSEDKKNEYRKQMIGIVFQDFHLFSEFTVLENVLMALEIQSFQGSKEEKQKKGEDILREVELLDKKNHLPSQLSGGQKQRVAIARAIIKNPKILLADEPTGNLDAKTGEKILDLLFHLAQKNNMGLWCVTHDDRISKRCDKIIEICDGKIVE